VLYLGKAVQFLVGHMLYGHVLVFRKVAYLKNGFACCIGEQQYFIYQLPGLQCLNNGVTAGNDIFLGLISGTLFKFSFSTE